VSEKKDYILSEWLSMLHKFSYPNYDIYLVDNSKDPEYHKKIWEYGIECNHIEPKGRAPEFIAASQNLLRQRFLRGNYDYFFSLECDNFAPPNVMELLLSFKKDNVNIPYFLKQGASTTLGVQHIIHNSQRRRVAKPMSPWDSVLEFDGKLKHYYAPSIGCSLFSKRLMQQVRFRVDPMQPGTFSDSFFHMDSNTKGIKPYVYMGAIAEHKRWWWDGNKDLVKAA
jgi:hypothetical protein